MLPLRDQIAKAIGDFSVVGRLAGGDIAVVERLRAKSGEYVLKSGGSMFASEVYGLNLMAAAKVAVPEVVGHGNEYLLMRYLPPGEPDEATAGRMLARLHQTSAASFGLKHDTYLATLLQNNRTRKDWAVFFFEQRLLPLLDGLATRDFPQWTQFTERVRPLLAAYSIPALLHGDLWSGNLYYSASGPVFIDPACYFGDPLVDVAMTQLFGGFGERFYSAYFGEAGRRDNEADLVRIYQLYPLLVHAHLFGGSYYRSACAVRDRFL